MEADGRPLNAHLHGAMDFLGPDPMVKFYFTDVFLLFLNRKCKKHTHQIEDSRNYFGGVSVSNCPRSIRAATHSTSHVKICAGSLQRRLLSGISRARTLLQSACAEHDHHTTTTSTSDSCINNTSTPTRKPDDNRSEGAICTNFKCGHCESFTRTTVEGRSAVTSPSRA